MSIGAAALLVFFLAAIAVAGIVAMVYLTSNVFQQGKDDDENRRSRHHTSSVSTAQREFQREKQRRDYDPRPSNQDQDDDEKYGGGFSDDKMYQDDDYDDDDDKATTGQECLRELRTFEGGHGRVRLRASDASAILEAMENAGRNRLTVIAAEASREASADPNTERGKAIAKINDLKPSLSITNTSRGTNKDFTTLHFDDDSIYFPNALFIDVCI